MKKHISDQTKQKYIELYKQTYSVSKIMETVNDGNGRNIIVNILKEARVYEGLSGPNYLKMKIKNHEELMMKKYGVKNWGQTKDGGYKSLNKIPYEKVSYLTDEYIEYKQRVEKITKKNIKKYYKNELPKYCYYTGIEFADVKGTPNPNDPRKRSVDHKTPILHCYLNEISEAEAGSIDNTVFVLKYVNSVKAQSTEESILPLMEKIRKVFINEGYKSN